MVTENKNQNAASELAFILWIFLALAEIEIMNCVSSNIPQSV
jgi:hypothetical protein